MTSPSGISGDGADPATSPHEAAGDGPTYGVKAARRRRPFTTWRAAFFALAVAGAVAAAGWILFRSPLLVVRSVIVSGTRLVPRSEVLAVSGVERGTPLILVNTAQAAARVDTIRQIRSAQVTRSWPNRVVIVVRERTPALALAAQGGGYDLMDAGGVIVRWAASRPAGLPLYLTAAPVATLHGDPGVAAAAAVLGELPAAVRHALASISAPAPDQVTLRLAGGITVLWGGTDRAGAKARELTLLMRGRMHYYDVSAQGSVTAKLLA